MPPCIIYRWKVVQKNVHVWVQWEGEYKFLQTGSDSNNQKVSVHTVYRAGFDKSVVALILEVGVSQVI